MRIESFSSTPFRLPTPFKQPVSNGNALVDGVQLQQSTVSEVNRAMMYQVVSSEAPKANVELLEGNARELEQTWAARLGPAGGKSTVAIVAMDSEVETRHVYLQELADAILDSGGTPKLVFAGRGDAKAQMKGIDSVLLPGGDDINPAMYGAQRLPTTDKPNVVFDNFEKQITEQALENKMPVLGICRGHQFLAAATGGKLMQSIELEHKVAGGLNHWDDAAAKNRTLRQFADHDLTVDPSSRLKQILGSTALSVNSIHHQAISFLGPLFVPIAWSPDGIIEGIQHKDNPWVTGVQFHPEWLRKDQPVYQKMFDTLVQDGVQYHDGLLAQPGRNPVTLTQM